jgi:superfamily II DNA or RNA helicase
MIDNMIANTLVQPRPYQRRIVGKIVDMYNGEHRRDNGNTEPAIDSAMIESPTGSGKTVMALLIAKAMQIRNPDLVIAWVAMRRNLLNQARRENNNKGIDVENVRWVSMFESNPDDLLEARRKGSKIMMVVDEAQHDAASSMSHLHNIIEPDLVLGMTATPFRTDRMKLCFQKVIKDCGIHQLIQDGYLAPYRHYTIPKWTPEDVAGHYCADPGRWGKSIFFFLNLEECYQLSRLFDKNGVRHEVVRGGQQKVTDRQLQMFEDGEIDCLINCMVLTEGFDCPTLQTAWIRDSSKGPTMQMAGRAFRQHPTLKYKQVVQSKLTNWPFPRTALPEEQYLWVSEQWRSLKVNPRLNHINLNARMAIASVNVSMPEFIRVRKDRRIGRNRGGRGNTIIDHD